MALFKKKKKEEEHVSSMVEHLGPKDYVVQAIVVILCGLIGFCSIIPLWHVLMSSVSDGKTLLTYEGLVIWPVGGFTLDGYKHIFQDLEIVRGYANTIFYTISATALGWFISATAGYALSRATKLRTFMITFITIPMMFGGGMLPTYMVIRSLGWVGTPLALIIPGCTNTMFIIMMMNACLGVSEEMYEAARIDGASHFQVFGKVFVPLIGNMSSVIILNSVVGQWNSWLQATIYVSNKREYWPLQLFVKELTNNAENFLQSSNVDYSRYLIQFAVIIVCSLPIVIAFPFFQDKLEKAAITGGVKG